MTHIENIPHILEHGITHISSKNNNPNYRAIGDDGLINNRTVFELPNRKKLGNYIPFYFWGRMPMLYVMQNGYNGVSATQPENIVYCVSTVQLILQYQLDFIFTDGHAVDSFSEFFEPGHINEIEDIIDFKAVKEQYWKKEDDLDLKRRKEAEFLVENDIPASAISKFAVFNENAKLQLLQLGVPENKILIRKDFYF